MKKLYGVYNVYGINAIGGHRIIIFDNVEDRDNWVELENSKRDITVASAITFKDVVRICSFDESIDGEEFDEREWF